jgi:hypothetical protein
VQGAACGGGQIFVLDDVAPYKPGFILCLSNAHWIKDILSYARKNGDE